MMMTHVMLVEGLRSRNVSCERKPKKRQHVMEVGDSPPPTNSAHVFIKVRRVTLLLSINNTLLRLVTTETTLKL